MGSDAHQVLAMSTMFTKDIYVALRRPGKIRREGRGAFRARVHLVVTVIAYLVALYLKEKQGIFEIAIRFAFSGFAAMAPVMIAALFWKRSTKWGALASTLFVAATLIISPACREARVRRAAACRSANVAAARNAPAQLPPSAASVPPTPRPTNAAKCVADRRPDAPPKPKVDIIWQVGDTHCPFARAGNGRRAVLEHRRRRRRAVT